MKTKLFPYLLLALLAVPGCVKDDIGNSSVDTFQFIWDELDQNYGGFAARQVDWDSMYAVYRPQVTVDMTEEALWTVCTELIDVLDDQHVYIIDFNTGKGFASGKDFDEVYAEEEFELATVKANYLDDFEVVIADIEEEFVYGTIAGKDIGYLYIPNFGYTDDKWYEQIDEAIRYVQPRAGLILDLRNNAGGSPLVNRYMDGRFVAEEKPVFSIRTRNGPAHTDFDEPTYYRAEADGPQQFTKPTIILTNHSTVSAGEEFVLFLETQPHVRVVGDSTSNAFSTTTFTRLLPIGWEFGLSNQLHTYPDGSSPEGVGIVPDIYLRNDSLEVRAGVDRVLEKAIELL